MAFSLFEIEKKEYLKKYIIKNKENITKDILNIKYSFSGRIDTPIANTFILEAVQLLINSIELFEKGYFDCAYYSLREAIEVSTVLIFLSDLSDEKRKEKIKDWKSLDNFPMQKQMLKYLSDYGEFFSDVRQKLVLYFGQIDLIIKKINKIVHKQGFQHFYISRNHPISIYKYDVEKFKTEFICNLEKCIGIVAVMRLIIDPFPVLLLDYEIYSRTGNLFTKPYEEDFVNKYIGEDVIKLYKETDIYKNHYDYYIDKEQMNPAILNIVKYRYIDTKKSNKIVEQIHILNENDYNASIIAINFKKVCKIYCYRCFLMYYTDRKTNRKVHSWSGADFQEFSKSKNLFNQKYDEAYISVIKLDEDMYLEHNVTFTEEEQATLLKFVEKNLNKKN